MRRFMKGSARGNIFTILLGGVLMTSAMGYMLYQTMSGPVSSMVRITKSTMTDSELLSLARGMVTSAVTADSTGGDCDADGSIEPLQWTAPTGGAPGNGGFLPAGVVSTGKKDAWGTPYGYCAWDVGSFSDPTASNGCTPVPSRRLAGSPNPAAETANPGLRTVMAIISAGPDRRFNTNCYNYSTTTNDATHSTTSLVAASGDDKVLPISYSEAQIMAGDIWTLKSGTPTQVAISKDLNLALSNPSVPNPVSATALTAAGTVWAKKGVQLGTQATATTCNVANKGMMRYNDSAGISVVQTTSLKRDVNVGNSGTNVSTVSFPARPAAGHAIIVVVAGKAGTPFAMPSSGAVTDSEGNTYTQVKEGDAATNVNTYIYANYNITAPTGTLTLTLHPTASSGNNVTWGAIEVAGLKTSSTLDQTGKQAGAQAGTSTVTSGANAQANDLAIALTANNAALTNACSYGAASGWAKIPGFENDTCLTGATVPFSAVWKLLSATGAASHQWTYNGGAGANTSVIATFKGVTATAGSAAVEFCGDTGGGVYAWSQAGAGAGGPVTPSATGIDGLNDSIADYVTTQSIGLGKYALDSNSDGTINGAGTYNTGVGMSALAAVSTGSSNTGFGYSAIGTATTSNNNTAFGYSALATSLGADDNTAVGPSALATCTGDFNTAFGPSALSSNGTGNGNTAFGYSALSLSANVSGSTAFGYEALKNNTAAANTAFGYRALIINTSGTQNTAFGAATLQTNTTGYANTAFGYQALSANSTGYNNTGFGYQALSANSTGYNNSGFGYQSLMSNTSGSNNAAAGYKALYASMAASNSTAAGYQALINSTGDNNTAAGYNALLNNTAGYNNTAAGYNALQYNTLGANNTAAGHYALLNNNAAVGIHVTQVSPLTVFRDWFTPPVTVTMNTWPNAGNAIIVVMYVYDDGTDVPAASITDNQGGTSGSYLDVANLEYDCWADGGGRARTRVYYRPNISQPSGPFIISAAVGAWEVRMFAFEVSGLDASNALDKTATGTSSDPASSTTVTTAALSQSSEFALAVGHMACNFGTPPTLESAWSQIGGDGAYLSAAYKVLSSTAPVSFTWTYPTLPYMPGPQMGGVIATFKGAPAPPADYGHENTAVGAWALEYNDSGDGNTALGDSTLDFNNTGSYNTAAGESYYWLSAGPFAALVSNTTGSGNTALGGWSMSASSTVSSQTAFGQFTLPVNTTGGGNTAIGGGALLTNTTGSYNTAAGPYALRVNTTGSYNTAVGGGGSDGTMYSNTTGNYNTALGAYSMGANTTGSGNTVAGDSLMANQTGSYNTAMAGAYACSENTAASYCTVVGFNAGRAGDVGSSVVGLTAIGTAALPAVTTGLANTAFGDSSLGGVSTGSYNTAFSETTLSNGGTTANSNTAFGAIVMRNAAAGAANNTGMGSGQASPTYVLQNLTSSTGVTAFGAGTGVSVTTGINNTLLGQDADTTGNLSNAMAVGYGAIAPASNTIRLGNTSISSITGQVAWTATSDRRYKKDIMPSDLGLDFIMKLRPVSYRMKTGNDRLDYGFIAQDVQAALDGRDTNLVSEMNDEIKTLGMRHEDLIAPLVRAVQERAALISRQQADIDALKADIEAAEKAEAAKGAH